MFDAIKLVGEEIRTDDMVLCTDCTEVLGIYPVVVRHNESGELYYEVSDTPDGKLMVYKIYDKISSVYFSNDVETSQLIDLL